VGAVCGSQPLVLPFYTPPSGSWCNLWSLMAVRLKGRCVTSTNLFKPLFLMAVRLTGRGVTSTNFSKPLFCRFRRHGCMKVTTWVEVTAWVRPIAREDSTDQGLSFLFFCQSHVVNSFHDVISTYGQSQSNDVNRSHGVSSTNCTRG
jgi:hypothetical protein